MLSGHRPIAWSAEKNWFWLCIFVWFYLFLCVLVAQEKGKNVYDVAMAEFIAIKQIAVLNV